ncbi:hypothetical protein ABZ612_36910 [Streptomyces avermitilis]|uniref:hypothetical protein n=1 Tax=Streptomyces avermitilis TaxID=33903 RepID=UPI0033F2B1B5
MSLDPGMLRLMAGESGLPMPRYEVGEVMYGDAIGEVVVSAEPSLGEGDLVMHRLGWREYAVAQARLFRRVDRDAYPTLSTHLGMGWSPMSGSWTPRNYEPATPSSSPARRGRPEAWPDRSPGSRERPG